MLIKHAPQFSWPWLEGNPDLVTIDTLKYIHAHKTGALLEVAVTSGAILAGAAEVGRCSLTLSIPH
jgi:geranylgeranyl pyrophosphate synthase